MASHRAFTAAMRPSVCWLLTPARRPSLRRRPCEMSISIVQVVLPCTLQGNNVPHVGGWLNGRNELERNIDEANERDDAGGDVVVPVCTTQNAADKEVDCVVSC
jgi:hypothetical protein